MRQDGFPKGSYTGSVPGKLRAGGIQITGNYPGRARTPEELKALQDRGDFTRLMAAQEELKTAPFGEVWDEYCRRCGKPVDGAWYHEVRDYEKKVLVNRT